MKKKILVLLLLLTILCTAMVFVGCDLDFGDSDIFVYKLNSFEENPNSYTVVGVTKTNITTAKIPAEHDGLPVTGIGYDYDDYDYAFSNCKNLTSVELPTSIKNIKAQAFMGCFNLESINIPDGVTSIGRWAFLHCNLKSIALPDGIANIGERAFSGCNFEGDLVIPSSVLTIGEGAFGSSGFDSVTVGISNPKYMSDGNCLIEKTTNKMLLGCKNSVVPSFVTEIAEDSLCPSSMESITVHEDNSYYKGDGNCLIEKKTNKLIVGCKNSVIPNYVTKIAADAFNGSKITSIEIPASVTAIEDQAFIGCTDLENITVAEDNAIYKSDGNCLIIKEINMLMSGCKNSIIPNYITYIAYGAFSGCTSLTNIEIPNSVTSIDATAFNGCTGLTSVVIPSSVSFIGADAFVECDNLTIYCEAKSQPSDWHEDWNSTNCPVVWGYKG